MVNTSDGCRCPKQLSDWESWANPEALMFVSSEPTSGLTSVQVEGQQEVFLPSSAYNVPLLSKDMPHMT